MYVGDICDEGYAGDDVGNVSRSVEVEIGGRFRNADYL